MLLLGGMFTASSGYKTHPDCVALFLGDGDCDDANNNVDCGASMAASIVVGFANRFNVQRELPRRSLSNIPSMYTGRPRKMDNTCRQHGTIEAARYFWQSFCAGERDSVLNPILARMLVLFSILVCLAYVGHGYTPFVRASVCRWSPCEVPQKPKGARLLYS